MKFNNAKLTGLFRTIFITTMLCMLMPVLAISFISIRSFSKSLSSEVKKNLQQLSIEKMNEVDSMIKNQIALTKAVAQSSYVIEDVASGSDGKILLIIW